MGYTAESINVLEGLEAVRKRPGMYIGNTGKRGLHHLIHEIVDNSIDEANAGFGNKIDVIRGKDNSITVRDYGRGIPTGIHPKKGVSALQVVLTTLHAGGKFDNNAYKTAGGLHGVGTSVVVALSNWLEATVYQNGKVYFQRYSKPVNENVPCHFEEAVKVIGDCPENKTGTVIKYLADPLVFGNEEYDIDYILEFLNQKCYLNPNLTIYFKDETTGFEQKIRHKNGLIDFADSLFLPENRKTQTHHIEFETTDDDGNYLLFEASFVYAKNNTVDNAISFVNSIPTNEGGYHVDGFFRGLVKSINTFASNNKLLKKNEKSLTARDVKEHLIAVVKIMYSADLQFQGQTKDKLGNIAVLKPIEQGCLDNAGTKNGMGLIEKALKRDSDFKNMIEELLELRRFKEEMKLSKEKIGKKNTSMAIKVPKLSTCTSKRPEETEIFIVEGDSAGGLAIKARNKSYQAILPIRGKITNIYKKSVVEIMKNPSIHDIVASLKTGILAHFDINKLAYHKVIILPDADIDGGHIKILVLVMLWKLMRPLVEEGYVYVAKPPLYNVKLRGKDNYMINKAQMNEFMDSLSEKDRALAKVQRFKGLGEMDPEELKVVMDPKTRVLEQVVIGQDDIDKIEAELEQIMGTDSKVRYNMLKEYILEACEQGEE